MKRNSWVSVACQIKKLEQPLHSKSGKHTRSPLHHERLVEDVHSGVSSHTQNTVFNWYPAPLCCSEAIVQLPISKCRISAHNHRTGSSCPLPESGAALSRCCAALRLTPWRRVLPQRTVFHKR